MTNQSQDYMAWVGHQVVDKAGEKVGKVSNLYFDDESGQPEWRKEQIDQDGVESSGDRG